MWSPMYVSYNNHSKENIMANIVLCRIDSRLIHGGCHEVGRTIQANRIAVVE